MGQLSPASGFENEVTGQLIPVENNRLERRSTYLSLRWKLLLPVATIILLVMTIGAYRISDQLTREYDENDIDTLLENSQYITASALELGTHHQREAFRIINTAGVRENIAERDQITLHNLIEPNATLAELDLVIVTDSTGNEIVGLQHTQTDDYTVSNQTDLSNIPTLTTVLAGAAPRTSGILKTSSGLLMVFTAMPVYSPANEVMGAIIVGSSLDQSLASWEADDEISLFTLGGILLKTSFSISEENPELPPLELTPFVVDQALNNSAKVTTETVRVQDTRYQVAYFPLVIDNTPVGILAIYQPSTTPFATNTARQMFSLIAALVAACSVIVVYYGIARLLQRIDHIHTTMESLIDGNTYARTDMQPNDEIGELAVALDHYADIVQHRTDHLVANLQRQRRETAHLTAVIESMPDGLVIIDLDGRVLIMNTIARKLIGGVSAWRTANFHQLTAVATDTLGPAIAPGIYLIGDVTRVPHNDKMLQAQTALVLSVTGKRLGLVVIVRDITTEIQREQRYDLLLEKLAQEIQLPIAHVAQNAVLKAVDTRDTPGSESLLVFAREIARNARSLQRIITELRDLTTFDPQDVEHGQHRISVRDLLWQLAAQWKPTANGAKLVLETQIPQTDFYILGDERRLRWAIGNVIDNAIKYSVAGRNIMLSSAEMTESGMAYLQIADQGVGILPENLPHVFERFYRGQPTLPDGTIIQQTGTGQGLHLSQKVIQAHGGQIHLESEVGKGTVVHIWLPLTAHITLEMPQQDIATIATQPIFVEQPVEKQDSAL